MKKMALTREDLLKRDELTIEEVDLGNNQIVYVREMTGKERDRFEQSLVKVVKDNKGRVIAHETDTADYKAKLVVNTACNEDGSLIFKPNDYDNLSINISAEKLEKIASAAQRLNKMSAEDKEEVVKNLDAGETGNSTSDSAGN